MKALILAICTILIWGCNSSQQKKDTELQSYDFFVGTYTNNTSEGIYKYKLNSDGSLDSLSLAAKSKNPSYLAFSANKKQLLAVNEIDTNGQGTVELFSVISKNLKLIGKNTTGGAHPCYISVNKKGYVLIANYTGGNLGLLKLENSGKFIKLHDIQVHSNEDSTKKSHAHASLFEPNTDNIISVNLGTNELIFSQIDTVEKKLKLMNQPKLKMENGAGPRHLTFHPNGRWLYVVNELNSTITQIVKNKDDTYEKHNSTSTLPSDYSKESFCADIHISKDGKFLYASNRGHNSITIFEVNEKNGSIKSLAHTSTKGEWPRNFSLSPNNEYLLVANQHTNNIVSFKRNKNTGLLKYVAEIKAPTPVCLLFM